MVNFNRGSTCTQDNQGDSVKISNKIIQFSLSEKKNDTGTFDIILNINHVCDNIYQWGLRSWAWGH